MSMSPATTAAALPPNAAVAAKATYPLAGPTMSGRPQAARRVEAEVADDLERAPACGELRSRGRSGSGARERRFVVEQKSALLARLRLVRAFASAHAPASAALQQCRWRRRLLLVRNDLDRLGRCRRRTRVDRK